MVRKLGTSVRAVFEAFSSSNHGDVTRRAYYHGTPCNPRIGYGELKDGCPRPKGYGIMRVDVGVEQGTKAVVLGQNASSYLASVNVSRHSKQFSRSGDIESRQILSTGLSKQGKQTPMKRRNASAQLE